MDIETTVTEFLKKSNTDYSILITGEWGAGKTYYARNYLMNIIRKQKIPIGNTEEKYTPVYISLNGIQDKEEVIEQLLPKLLNYSENREVLYYLSKSTLKHLGKKYIGRQSSRKLIDRAEKMNLDKLKKLEKSVLIFDDLERISPTLPISDLIGYLNSLFIEKNQYKTLFIANQTKFQDEINDNLSKMKKIDTTKKESIFLNIKEKIFRYTLHFQPNLKEIIEDLLAQEKYKDESFQELIQRNDDFIINIFDRGKHVNIRTLKFIFDILKDILSAIDRKLFGEFEKQIVLFVTAVSIEYKEGRLNTAGYNPPEFLTYIEQYEMLEMISTDQSKPTELNGDETNASQMSMAESFYNKYLKKYNDSYTYFDALYSFISSGYLNENLLTEELEELIPEFSGRPWEIFRKLDNFEILDDVEFIEYTDELVEYIETGKYNIYLLPKLYILLKLFIEKDMVSFNEGIFHIFRSGIQNSVFSETDVDSFDKLMRSNKKLKNEDNDFKKLIDLIEEKHNEMKHKELQNEYLELFSNITECYDGVFFKLFHKLKSLPVFQFINSEVFLNQLADYNNESLNAFNTFLNARFEYCPVKREEITIIEEIIHSVKYQLESISDSPVRKYLLKRIFNTLEAALK